MRPLFSMPQSARARRLDLGVEADEKEQAEDAVTTAILPGALAGIVKQTSQKDFSAISRFESLASVRRNSQSQRSLRSIGKGRSSSIGGPSKPADKEKEKDENDGFEEIQMTAATKD